MKSKSILVTIILALAVTLSACGPAAINQAASAPQRTLNVNGTGEASMTPNIAYIYLGVHTENASASDAVAENNAQTQKAIDALKGFGIDPKDIRTTNFSIYPSQKYDANNQPTGTTYMVDNTVYVTVRNLAKLGDLLDMVIKSGVNTVNSIQFDVADKTSALKQARDEAVKDAQNQAQELAAAAGVKLGDVQSISFFDNIPTPQVDGKGGGGAVTMQAAVPIQPGQLTLTVTVSMTYEIK